MTETELIEAARANWRAGGTFTSGDIARLINGFIAAADERDALASILSEGVAYFREHAADTEVGQWWLRQIERVFAPVTPEGEKN